jgi:hypothetical protein
VSVGSVLGPEHEHKNNAAQTLAKAIQAVGAYQAMQLDINNYYVIFTRFEDKNGQLIALPLLSDEIIDNVGRFLDSYSRDFFYITSRGRA